MYSIIVLCDVIAYCFWFRLFLPGWTTLTWNMLNIDAFLHQIDTAATMLSSVVQETATILQWRVYGVIDSIRATSLYDEQLATSRPWVSR